MRTFGIILLLVAGSLWVRDRVQVDLAPAPSPTPAPAVTIPAELSAALTAAAIPANDKHVWGGLLQGMGRFVAADGAAKAPLIVTIYHLENLRNAALQAPIDPVSGGDLIGKALAPYLAKVGTSTERLDEAGRRAAIVALLVGAGEVLANVE